MNEPSGLWSFAVDRSRVGLAVQYNSLALEWYVVAANGELRQIDSGPQLYLELRALSLYLQDHKLVIARTIYDHEAREAPLLITRSTSLYGDFMRGRK